MALKKLKVKINPPAATASNGEIPIVSIEGDLIEQYNKASKQAKDAEAVMNDLKPEIIELGLTEIFTRSCADNKKPTPTVRLKDDNGAVLRVQFTKRYSAVADVEAVEALFEEELKADINLYVQEIVVPSFDAKVLYDADGNFDQKRYDAFRTAIERVAKTLGIDCPLKTDKAVKPKELFHEERFRVWPDASTQFKLSALLPNTNQVVPDLPKDPKSPKAEK